MTVQVQCTSTCFSGKQKECIRESELKFAENRNWFLRKFLPFLYVKIIFGVMAVSPAANKAYVQLDNFNVIKKNEKGILTAVRISSCSICSSSICCCFSSLSRDKRVRLFCSSRNCWRSLSRSSSC